ncbi:hypothetical protein NQ315_016913 [Exocentrus adspersus]|uniref:Homeobox domain-containing protein n=1 Tax=Exocentrus adspersus TaxID=1586481 RepID=A0AAV8VXP5_9CUCU|nr:hypothetical protein NQ315_016913 [Exocentrus adspersus]
MPFRIENILKKGDCNSCKGSEKGNEEDAFLKNTQTESILQQTLLNRFHPYSYCTNRSSRIGDNLNFGYFSPYSCEKPFYQYPQHFYDPYVQNDYSYIPEVKYYSVCNMPYPPIFSGPYNMYTKRKGGQVRFTPNQTDILEKRFTSNKYLSPEDRKRLADNLKLSDRQVKTWFQNRRAKWRRSTSSTSSEISDSGEKMKRQSEIFNTAVVIKNNLKNST